MKELKYKIEIYDVLSSTQEKAKELGPNAKPGYVIMAKEQTKGYGKEKIFWFSPKGGLYFSVILPKTKIEDVQILTFLTALVISQTIKERFSLEPLIKLPNDILINQKKICGILTENVLSPREVKLSIIGVGLNTNIEYFPEELKEKATSLKIELGKDVDNQEILEEILKKLKEYLDIFSID